MSRAGARPVGSSSGDVVDGQRRQAQKEEESHYIGDGGHHHARCQGGVYAQDLEEEGHQRPAEAGDDHGAHHGSGEDGGQRCVALPGIGDGPGDGGDGRPVDGGQGDLLEDGPGGVVSRSGRS